METAIAAEPSQQPPPPQPQTQAQTEPSASTQTHTTEPPQAPQAPQPLPEQEAQKAQNTAEVPAEATKPDEPPSAPDALPSANVPAEPSASVAAPAAAEDKAAPAQEQRPPSPQPEDIQIDEEAPKPPTDAQQPKTQDIQLDQGTTKPVPEAEKPAAEKIEVDPKPETASEIDSRPSVSTKEPSPTRAKREATPPPPTRADKVEDGMDIDNHDSAPSGPRPSSALYITGLRRPLQATALASYLSSKAGTGSSDDDYDPPSIRGSAPFVSPSCPYLWLSGIKDHAYYRTWSVSAASAIKAAVDGKKWPEGDINAGTLSVTFVPDGKVDEFAQTEEEGWRNGRQRFELVQDQEGCRLQPLGKVKTGPPPPEPGAARGLLGRLGNRIGPAGRAPVRGGPIAVPIRGRAGGQAGPGGPMRWTRARPSLAWSTGPRA